MSLALFTLLRMTKTDFFQLLVGNAVLFAALQGIASMWLKSRLEYSIRQEYEMRLRDYERQLRMRDRAAMIAELFAEWTAMPDDPKRLNQLAWQASLWLPADIVKTLAQRLSNAPDAPDLKSVLVAARKHLWSAADNVTEDDIIHFLPPAG
jgi:hypothetical protein